MIKLRQAIEAKVKLWDEVIASASNENVGARLAREKKRWLCRNDLYYLGLLTGHSKFIDPFHKEFCDLVSLLNWQVVRLGVCQPNEDLLPISSVVDNPDELGKTQRLFLMFRSAFKTTIITKLHTVQLLLNFPDIHIAITHNTQENASDNLESVKNLFLSTRLRDLFPEYIPKGKDWGNKTGFSLACRKNFTLNGENVEALGIGTEATGRKYHLFKNDDIVTEASVTNDEQLKQSRDFIDMHKFLFVNPSVVLEDYAGTRYHFADAYNYLEENPNVFIYIKRLLYEHPEGDILWKGKKHKCIVAEEGEGKEKKGFSKTGIVELMADEYKFNCQNMLNPEDPKKVKFTEEMIQYYSQLPEGLNFYLVVDPADSEEKRACYTAMEIWGVDKQDNWYWADSVFDKIDDRERIDKAIELAKKWRVFEVLWEALSFGRTDERNFERASRLVPNGQRTWSVRKVMASHSSKDDRILGLNDRYSRRKVFWPQRLIYYSKFEGKNIDVVQSMEYEFKSFPLCSHKDLLDAQSFLLQIDLIPGDGFKPKEESKFAHIPDPVQRGNTEVFWHDWDTWKRNGFKDPNEMVSIGEDFI